MEKQKASFSARIAADFRSLANGELTRWQRTLMLVVVVIATIVGVVAWATGLLEADQVGYPGVFLINLVGSASLILPVPGAAAACIVSTPGSGLNPFFVGVLAGIAQALGESTGYLAGKSGQSIAMRSRHYRAVHRWMGRAGAPALFLFAVIPNPFFDLAGVAAGSLGYPYRRFLVVVLAGKVLRSIAVSYVCFYGFDLGMRFI